MNVWRTLPTVTTIEEFERELEHIIHRPTALRPFVCNGSPLACRAFIVGFNPATSMNAGFWDFWRSGDGFDKEKWLECYKDERQRRPLAPGKTRRSAVSPSRRVIEWIIEEARPVGILETNIYASATEKAKELAKEQQCTQPFEFLLDAVKPSILVVHGTKAADYFRAHNDAGRGAKIIEKRHFSRGWSEADARALGREIMDECASLP
ncbi:hypothetical protein [Dyella sp.]|uniref:hypothetical protein n=1 Tax=Dyella sp. TaxID=1869338 RepID=UPI00283CAC93|nr:hypothetical protein [Dyella sp.]MDR3447555.1 hypothetical protein [Dyella sp.]